MYAWERVFTDVEVREWIEKNLACYAASGLGHFLIVEKSTDQAVGYTGLAETCVNSVKIHEISYMLRYDYWHQGLAHEVASALVHHAFVHLLLPSVIFEIRPENKPSVRVAEKLGAIRTGQFMKYYLGKGMLHAIYTLQNNQI